MLWLSRSVTYQPAIVTVPNRHVHIAWAWCDWLCSGQTAMIKIKQCRHSPWLTYTLFSRISPWGKCNNQAHIPARYNGALNAQSQPERPYEYKFCWGPSFWDGNSFIKTVKSQSRVNRQPFSDFRLMLNDLLRSGSHLQIRKEINIFSKFLMGKMPIIFHKNAWNKWVGRRKVLKVTLCKYASG